MNADCQTDYDPNSLALSEARARILSSLSVVHGCQTVPLLDALNRVLSSDINAPRDVPPYRNSAMDGFACRSADLESSGTASLRVVGESLAGHAYTKNLGAMQAIRIMTGAVLPDNADAVVMQERTESDNTTVSFDVRDAQNKSFVRERGSDSSKGETLMQAGVRLGPAQIALLASLGIHQLQVHRKPLVAILSTGDELVEISGSPAADQIFDSNRPALRALLQNAHVDTLDLGICPDDPNEIRLRLLKAAASADLIVSSGGVSVGTADHLRAVLADIGQLNFWKIAMKPGRPLSFGQIENTPYFGLPGNPVSTLVTFQQLVAPALKQMAGEQKPTAELQLEAVSEHTLNKQAGRQEFQRGYVRQDENGELWVSSTGAQDSHRLSSISRANCLIDLAAGSAGAKIGDRVRIHLL